MKKILRNIFALMLAGISTAAVAADITVTDNGTGTGTITWTSDNVYILDGFVFVNSGQTLTIEAGTVIKGMPGTGAEASALVVARGGRIIANGTASAPIIMTFEGDALDGSTPYNTVGQWGGLIILGNAGLNSTPGETQIEGIPETEPRGIYGGNNDADDSGILRYVSVRHGGTDIGAGNEINGITFGGVGSNTIVEHVEVFSTADDGFEFFGGTVNVKWASAAFCGDDSFDYDEGWRGKGQFWFTVQDPSDLSTGDRGGEHDGGTEPEDGTPYAIPTIYNATYIGQGIAANNRALTIRDNAGGKYYNGIFANWARGVDVENLASGQDSYNRFLEGDFVMSGNVFQDVVADGDLCAGQTATGAQLFRITMGTGWASPADSTAALTESAASFAASFAANGNMAAETGIEYNFTEAGGLNPVPNVNYSGATPATDSWFTAATYKGAFDPGADNWLNNWSAISNYGFMTPTYACGQTIIVSDSGSGVGTTTWRACNTYVLDGFVFVNDGQCLTIEPGTVIKGQPGTGAEASALVVARGGKIYAEGNANRPIIFTFEGDPLDGSVPYTTAGQWGGVLILGNAGLNSTPGETQIEGIPETEPRGIYGGDNDEDNSGILKYISIRHGGTDIGAGNEINGLTLGGVGSATIIDFVEVVSNADDGIEFFGGTVNARHCVTAYCGDDSFDYDEGWRGKGQFWFTIQDANTAAETGDRGGEHDGGTEPEDGTPYATPVIANATYMGQGIAANNRALTFRDNAGGQYHNSIFYNWGRGVDIENLASGEDSYARFETGELALAGNCFYNVRVEGSGATASQLFTITMGTGWASAADSTAALTASAAAFADSFAANGNETGNPGVAYDFSGDVPQISPAPLNNTVASSTLEDSWFIPTTYKGAFANDAACTGNTWLDNWSYLATNGHIACVEISVEELEVVAKEAIRFMPNPTNGMVAFNTTETLNNARIEIYSITGKLVYEQASVSQAANSRIELNLTELSDGFYTVRVVNGGAITTGKVVVKH